MDAYRSALVIELLDADALMPSTIFHRFPEFEVRSLRDYNVSYKFPPKWAAVTYTYLLALLFGQVLDQAIQDQADLSDGAAFVRRCLNRTFATRIGRYYINPSGETQSALVLSHFDVTNSSFRQVIFASHCSMSVSMALRFSAEHF
ncbi:hypothetical protein RvY_12269-2 [Ramazzottius varieornatus]|uniref:Receptor ligand binding region domain-containing protein n=1 Tax=Ramazzottius varieornatus TaxID=947166 RepID=A0A1D1VJ04_RAMVA|nr:hypothetical protein RvY_12269-2 [Ramazzottius varieornatus]